MNPGRRAAAPVACCLLILAATAVPARAQEVCQGLPIRAIRIYPRGEPGLEGTPLAPLVRRVSDGLSWDTRPRAISRELRFKVGEPCDLLRLAESERVLRAQSYIRSASITTSAAPGDSVDVMVVTRDEWSLGGNIRFDGGKLIKQARVTENNLFGMGIFGQLRYDYFGRRAGLVANVIMPEVFDHSDAEMVVGHTSVGPVLNLSLRKPFESEYDRFAWRLAGRWREEPFLLRSALLGTVVQPQTAAGAELSIARRWGPPGRQSLFGISLSYERLFTGDAVLATLPADDSAAAAALAGRFQERRRLAVNLVGGLRSIRHVPRGGVDAVNATEDVRLGYELRAVGGAGFGYQMGLQEDRFGLVDLFVGGEIGWTLVFFRSRVEGRWLPDDHRWENIIATADLFTYSPLGRRATLVVGVQGAGGWSTSVPFQLTLSGPTALRGFGYSARPAGRRFVIQTEHRYFVGSILGFFDLGSTVFFDVGRGWAGDAPFGENSPTLVAVGGGVRAGFPRGSRFTTRIDLAVPVLNGRGAELRFSIRQQFGITRIEATDVERSRQPVPTVALVNSTRY